MKVNNFRVVVPSFSTFRGLFIYLLNLYSQPTSFSDSGWSPAIKIALKSKQINKNNKNKQDMQ